MSKTYKQCQSCGMPLKNGEEAGTEVNGDKSTMYCKFCYQNGVLTQPDITLEEMKKVVDDALKGKRWIKPLRWLAVMQLPSLERWKAK